MAVFGIPTLHEDDALRAVRAAVDLAPALQPLNADLASRGEAAIELRVGIQTGEVVADEATGGDSLATGDTLNTAARLEQVAKPGEIVIGRTTYLLVRDAVSADAIDDLVLRGKRSAVAAYRVAGLAGRASQVPRAEIPIVGRADELGILHRALEAATRLADTAARDDPRSGRGRQEPARSPVRRGGGQGRPRAPRTLPAVRRRDHLLGDRGDPPLGGGDHRATTRSRLRARGWRRWPVRDPRRAESSVSSRPFSASSHARSRRTTSPGPSAARLSCSRGRSRWW